MSKWQLAVYCPEPYIPTGLATALLLVNSQFHDTGARVLYGSNTFLFSIGIHMDVGCHRRFTCYGSRLEDFPSDDYKLNDNISNLAPQYLRLVKHCGLHVQLLRVSAEITRRSYFRVAERLKNVAGRLSEGHNLKRLDIVYHELDLKGDSPRRENGYYQNVLEPLGTIYGIPEIYMAGNTKYDLAPKLMRALQGDHVACVATEVKYGFRKVRNARSGRRKRHQYRLGKFYDSGYIWEEDTQLPVQPAAAAGDPGFIWEEDTQLPVQPAAAAGVSSA